MLPSRAHFQQRSARRLIGAAALACMLGESARAEEFRLLVGVDVGRWPGVARAIAPQPGPGFPNNFYDGDRLAGTADVGPVIAFAGLGTPLFQPNQFGAMSFTLRRGSVPAPPFQIPLMGIDFLGGPLLDLDGDPDDGVRTLVPVIGRTAAAIPGSASIIDLTLDTELGTIALNGFDVTGTNEGGPSIPADTAVTLTIVAGTQPDGAQTGPINPDVDRREGLLTPFNGTSGTLRGVFRVTGLGYELWQDTLLANSSTAGELGTFQFLGTFRGWIIQRDTDTGLFPVLGSEGLGQTLWPLVNADNIGQEFNSATTLPGGPAVILDGYLGDLFTALGNGGLALSSFDGDLGTYLDQVVIPRIHPLSQRVVYMESAGFGVNNSADPIYLDTTGYDVVVVAQSAPAADLFDFAAFQSCFSGDGTAPATGCDEFDFDSDVDVDLEDYNEFQEFLTGVL